jgi:hypothetical protein
LGLSSFWANTGVEGRELDYQIWAGPAIGSFNDWAAGDSVLDIKECAKTQGKDMKDPTLLFPSVVDINKRLFRDLGIQC